MSAPAQNWTPGPWRTEKYLGKTDNWFIRGPNDERVCGQGSGPVREANARRIVECVNACANIPNPAAIAEVVAALEVLEKLDFDWNGHADLYERACFNARQALASLRGAA